VIFGLAKILRAEQLRQANDLRAFSAASRMKPMARSRFSLGSAPQRICTSATFVRAEAAMG
jgi:hypothetical protein